MSEVPEWIMKVAGKVASMFSLDNWTIRTFPDNAPQRPEGEGEIGGLATMRTYYYEADLFFDRTLDPDTKGVEIVVHEVLHVAFAGMRDTVNDIASFVADEDQRALLFGMYERAEEQLITRLSRGMARDYDFTPWINPDQTLDKELVGDATFTEQG